MLATWILGTFLFVFLIAFIVYVLRNQPKTAVQNDSSARNVAPIGSARASKGPYHFSRDYWVMMSAQAFVNYPLGLKVIFSVPGQKESPSNDDADIQRGFEDSDYYSWPQLGEADPQLIVERGTIEFEDDEPEPAVRVILQFDKAVFEATQTGDRLTLNQAQETIGPFWLNPLTEQESSVTLVIYRDTPSTAGGEGHRSAARSDKPARELAAVTLPVKVTHFPIRLR